MVLSLTLWRPASESLHNSGLSKAFGKPKQPSVGDDEDRAPIDHNLAVDFIRPKPEAERHHPTIKLKLRPRWQ
jgi:hypothetical protein